MMPFLKKEKGYRIPRTRHKLVLRIRQLENKILNDLAYYFDDDDEDIEEYLSQNNREKYERLTEKLIHIPYNSNNYRRIQGYLDALRRRSMGCCYCLEDHIWDVLSEKEAKELEGLRDILWNT